MERPGVRPLNYMYAQKSGVENMYGALKIYGQKNTNWLPVSNEELQEKMSSTASLSAYSGLSITLGAGKLIS